MTESTQDMLDKILKDNVYLKEMIHILKEKLSAAYTDRLGLKTLRSDYKKEIVSKEISGEKERSKEGCEKES